jgi:cytochrome c-type biogenesis protein CcmH
MSGGALAVEPDEILSDPQLETRARDISTGLRCLVCQNQSIDDSNAPLARDLRILVRERLKAGDSDAQVLDYIVDRYGEFVLLRPRFNPHTYVLWLGTPLLLILALAVIFFAYRRRATGAEPAAAGELSAAEKKRLNKLLDQA